MGISHDERKLCLNRVSVPSVTYISKISTNILNGNVISDSTFINKILCYENVIRIFALKKMLAEY